MFIKDSNPEPQKTSFLLNTEEIFRSSLVGDDVLKWQNSKFGYCPSSTILLCINTAAHHLGLGRYKALSPSSKEVHGQHLPVPKSSMRSAHIGPVA